MDGLKVFLENAPGQPLQDIWTDIERVSNTGKERVGYPTQKPIALLDRIIKASSDPGDVVFDPFCGCGTTIYSAVRNNRKWIGCDIAILPIQTITKTLVDDYAQVQGFHFDVGGIPFSVEQAKHLAENDPFQFQHWLVEKVGGFPMLKKVADRGIDGRMYFETKGGLREVILSVKGGKLRPSDVRDLRGVIEREGADIGALLSLNEPTRAMRDEAASAGQYEYAGNRYDRVQLLSVPEIFERRSELHTPTKVGARTPRGQMAFAI